MTFNVSSVVFDVQVDASGTAALIVVSSASSLAKEFIVEVPEKTWASAVLPVRQDLSVGLPALGDGYELVVRTYDTFGADLVRGSTHAVRVNKAGIISRATVRQGTLAPAPAPAPKASRPGVPVIGWLLPLGLVLAVLAWTNWPPADPCESGGLLPELDVARKVLAAGDYVSALSKLNVALVTCTRGPRVEEIRGLQDLALDGVLAVGKRCLRDMDADCLLRVRVGLAPLLRRGPVASFMVDFERDVGARVHGDLELAHRCRLTGDIDCAEQRLRLAVTLRGTAADVETMSREVRKARSAVSAATACVATGGAECALAAVEGLRAESPQSPLVMQLLRRISEESALKTVPERNRGVESPSVSTPTFQASRSTSEVRTPESITANLPDIRVADRWVMRTTDPSNPTWSNSNERVVTSVTPADMIMDSRSLGSSYRRVLTFTREWNLISSQRPDGTGIAYAPPLHYFDFPLVPGKTWRKEVRRLRSDGGPELVYSLAGEVQGSERVQVAAGEFETIRVLLRVEVREDGVLLSQATDTSWYSPVARRSVKTEQVSIDLLRDKRTARSIELVEYSVPR